MQQTNGRIRELFVHARRIIDILEDVVLRPPVRQEDRTVHKPIAVEVEEPALPAEAEKLAYSIKEVRRLVGISNSMIYRAIGEKELRAVKRGKRTMILAKDLHDWIRGWPSAR